MKTGEVGNRNIPKSNLSQRAIVSKTPSEISSAVLRISCIWVG